MKKIIISLLVVVATAAIGAGVFFVISSKGDKTEEQKSAPSKAFSEDFVVLINIKQLVEKGELLKLIEPEQRQLYATLLAANVDDKDADYVKSAIMDFTKTGFSINKPAYAYLREIDSKTAQGAIVIDVDDANNVDCLFEVLKNNGADLDITHNGDMRLINCDDFDDEVAIGYNSERFIISTSEEMLNNAFETADPDFGFFGNRDFVIWADINAFFDLIEQYYRSNIEELEEDAYYNEWAEQMIETNKAQLAQLNESRKTLNANASLTMGLTFEEGRIKFDCNVDGIATTADNPIKMVDNKHLAYIPYDTFAVANLGIDGAKLAKTLNNILTEDIAAQYGMNTTEYAATKEIVSSVLNSMNGDLTIAANKMQGYSIDDEPYFEACAAVDVIDRYIISNVGMFAQGFAVETGADAYEASLDGNDLYFGQQGNTIYASINTEFKEHHMSALNARWAESVKDTYNYLLLDVNNLMEQSYVKAALSSIKRMMSYEIYNSIMDIINMIDYAYFATRSVGNAEFAIVLKDKNNNSLSIISNKAMEIAPKIVNMNADYDDEYYYEDEYYEDDVEATGATNTEADVW